MPTKRKRDGTRSFARLDAFSRGVIWGLHLAKSTREDMCKYALKEDGTSPSQRAVDEVIAHKTAHPEWRGTDSRAGGRPCSPTDKQKQTLVDLVFAERGKAKVTIPYCKKRLLFLREVNRKTVERALQDAGLQWLRRRIKTALPRSHKPARLEYANWLLTRSHATLRRFAYTDGTTFYLARGATEHEDKKRVALGRSVWRMANGKDGIWDANVGPSLYAKAQGRPFKIWGFSANGRLEYYLLPKDGEKTTHMTGDRYAWLISVHFANWPRACFDDDDCVHLVQDHERCLWQERNLDALRKVKCPVVRNFPKYSSDLNAIENWWAALRERLEATAPEEMEERADFVCRLRRTVHWLNEHRREEAVALATNQKDRARDVVALGGAKTKW